MMVMLSFTIRKILEIEEHEVSHGILVFGDVATLEVAKCFKKAHLGVMIQLVESYLKPQIECNLNTEHLFMKVCQAIQV